MYTINNIFAYGALVFQRSFASITVFDPPTLLWLKLGRKFYVFNRENTCAGGSLSDFLPVGSKVKAQTGNCPPRSFPPNQRNCWLFMSISFGKLTQKFKYHTFLDYTHYCFFFPTKNKVLIYKEFPGENDIHSIWSEGTLFYLEWLHLFPIPLHPTPLDLVSPFYSTSLLPPPLFSPNILEKQVGIWAAWKKKKSTSSHVHKWLMVVN